MIGLYKFYVDYGRYGILEGLFIEDSANVENAMGWMVEFKNCLKHFFCANVTLDSTNVTLLSQDKIVLHVFRTHDLCSGINPILHMLGSSGYEDYEKKYIPSAPQLDRYLEVPIEIRFEDNQTLTILSSFFVDRHTPIEKMQITPEFQDYF